MQPLVSVVMPTYNNEKYIAQAIKSILHQTYTNFEFIIVDDGSTDKTAEIVNAFKDTRIKYIKNPINIKTTKSLNKGISMAKGKYIVRMDSDDWAYPQRIKQQVSYMEKHPDTVVCGSAIEVCNNDLKTTNIRTYPLKDKDIRNKLFRYNPFAHPATIWQRKAVETVGLYNEALPLTQDYDLIFRVGKVGKFANLGETLIKLRTHAKASSIKNGFKQQKITLYTRFRAITKYGYKASPADIVYGLIQGIAMLILPTNVKFWLFNKIRRFI